MRYSHENLYGPVVGPLLLFHLADTIETIMLQNSPNECKDITYFIV